MADVFISYKREDIGWARGVAQALSREGYSVFYDVGSDGIQIGDTWDKRLERELAVAKAVVVLWSPESCHSDNVRDEARRAKERGILCPAYIAHCTPPLGLGTVQTVNLTKWRGDISDTQWRSLIDRGVAPKVLGRTTHPPPPHQHRPSPNQAAASAEHREHVFRANLKYVNVADPKAVEDFLAKHPDYPNAEELRRLAPLRRWRGKFVVTFGYLAFFVAVLGFALSAGTHNRIAALAVGAAGGGVGAVIGWIVGSITYRAR